MKMIIHSNKNKCFNYLAILLLMLLSVGCSKHGDGNSSQVVAKVDGVDISVHQLNQYLSKLPNLTTGNSEKAKTEVLSKLIEQQVIVNRALKDNLDRSPEFVMAMEAAKKELLTRYYLSKLAASSKVAESEIKAFYDGHPELFSNRMIYNFHVLEVASSVDSSVKDMVENQKSVADISAFLRIKGINFSEGSYVKPAEQMPMEVLSKVQSAKENEVVMFAGNNRTTIIQFYKLEKMPLDLGKASPLIKTFISNNTNKKVISDTIADLKKNSKIEYVGEFAKLNESSSEFVGNKASSELDGNSSETKSQSSEALPKSDASVDKGLSGLK